MLKKIHISITALLAGAVIVLFVLLLRNCGSKNISERDFNTLAQMHMRDSLELIDKNNKLGQASITAIAYELSKKDIDKYVAENAILKNKLTNAYSTINSINVTATNFHVDTIIVKVPVHDTLPCGDFDKSYPVLDRYYSFNFNLKIKNQHPDYFFTNFNIPDTCTNTIGVKKSGFLNMKRTLISEQSHTNKNIRILGVETIVKSEAKPKRIGIGFSVGYGFQVNAKDGITTNPYIGISVNYNIFEF